MGFFRQEYWSGLPFPAPGDLPDLGIELWSPVLQADSLPSEPPGKALEDTGGKEPACQCRINPWIGKIPWRRKWHPTPEFLPEESHG